MRQPGGVGAGGPRPCWLTVQRPGAIIASSEATKAGSRGHPRRLYRMAWAKAAMRAQPSRIAASSMA